MKKSYKKILVFQTIIFITLFLNSFVSNILKGYNFVLLLIILLLVFKFLFGFERDRHVYTKDIIFEIFIYLLIFFILYYLFGLVIGFAKTADYYNWYGLKTFIIPLIITIILKEILRYMMLQKIGDNKLLLLTTYILFVFIEISDAIYYNGFNSAYKIFLFIALTLLPALVGNCVYNYMSKRVGYKPVIIYLLITQLYLYLIPIVPNPNEYIMSLIRLFLPVILGYRIYKLFLKNKDVMIKRDYNKKSIMPLLTTALLTSIVIYFTSGYFHYYAVAVASGSMNPGIKKGDIVIVEKIDKKYSELKIGDVIAYTHNNVTVVHRLIKIVKIEDKYYFYTKGDANANPDGYAIEEAMVVGKVNVKMPYIGYPTVWLNEMW